MKRISLAFVLALAGVFCGCATTGYEHASEINSAINTTKTLTMKIQQNVNATGNALQKLTSQEAADLRQPYQNLSTMVDTLDGQVNNLADQVQVIRERGNDYIAQWQQELSSYQSSAIRSRSADRRNQMIEDFQKVGQQFEAAGQALRPWLTDLKDVRRDLKTDLTSAGVTSIQEQIGGVTNQASGVQQSLQSLLDELNRVSTELSPVRQAAEPPMPGK